MEDLLLENYIKEAIHDFYQEDLQEISLKDFNPKTSLETGLQIGTLSLLAFLGVEMNKSSELPTEPSAQAELVVDAAKDLGIIKSRNLQQIEDTKDMLEDAFEEKPIKVVYDQISSNKMRKLRNWLSDKSSGHEVSYDDHILSREEFKRFNSINDYKLNKGREPLTIDEFVELIELEKQAKKQEQRREDIYQKNIDEESGMLKKDENGMPIFDMHSLGLDDDGNFDSKRFVEDATGLSIKLIELQQSGAYDKGSQEIRRLYKIRQTMDSSSSFLSMIDEDGNWKDGDIMTADEIARYYENAEPEVKEVVGAHLNNAQQDY